MKEFIELTRVFGIEDEGVEESRVFVSVGHIDFLERIEEDSLTEVHTHNYCLFVRETPQEILKLLEEPVTALNVDVIYDSLEKHEAHLGMLQDRMKVLLEAMNNIHELNEKLCSRVLKNEDQNKKVDSTLDMYVQINNRIQEKLLENSENIKRLDEVVFSMLKKLGREDKEADK